MISLTSQSPDFRLRSRNTTYSFQSFKITSNNSDTVNSGEDMGCNTGGQLRYIIGLINIQI
jgi:hypothetical protein